MIQRSTFLSLPSQTKRLHERHTSEAFEVTTCGMNITVEPGVYQTSGDSELMAESADIRKNETFLEVGCGTGVVSLAMAKRASHGTGVDINILAVNNSRRNAEKQHITNVVFLESNLFENVEGQFDVIVCNPPYTNHDAHDAVDRMFWDPNNEMKQAFFKEVGTYLKPHGRMYFGWADFADIDVELPFVLATTNGYKLINTFSRRDGDGFAFYVFEFTRKDV